MAASLISTEAHRREEEGQTCDVSPQAPHHPTFHDAIQHFMSPPNSRAKPMPPVFKKKARKRDVRLEKPQFELSKESALPAKDEEKTSPRRFDGSSTAVQFKSPAVYCEVKLAELLSKGKEEREKPATPGKYKEAPDAYRTSVCCQVLYFELVGSLEKKNDDLAQERENLKVVVFEKESQIEELNKVVKNLNKEIVEKQDAIAHLQHNLASTSKTLDKSNKEVERLTDQVAKSRLEVFHAKEIEKALEEEKARYENLMAKHVSIIHELQHYQSNLEVARKEAADGVPKKEMASLKVQIKDLQQKLLKAEMLTEQMETMTPRPQWALLRGGAYYTMSTAAQAAEICKLNDMLLENVTSLRVECATAQVALAEAKQKKKPGRGGLSSLPKSTPLETIRPNST